MEFSIIIPILNPTKSLYDCIDSIKSQSCNSWEILLVDYYSPNISEFHNLIEKTPSLRYMNAPSKGIYSAINYGFKRASGKWILVLGHDDLLFKPTVLEKVLMYSSLPEKGYGGLYGDVKIRGISSVGSDGEIYSGRFTCDQLYMKNICQQAIFYNREKCLQIPGFKTLYPVKADWEFNIRLGFAYGLKYIPVVVSVFSGGGTSSMVPDTYRPQRTWRNIVAILLENKRIGTNSFLLELASLFIERRIQVIWGYIRRRKN